MSTRFLREIIATAYDADMVRIIRRDIERTIAKRTQRGDDYEAATEYALDLTGDLFKRNPGLRQLVQGWGDEDEDDMRAIVAAFQAHHTARAAAAVLYPACTVEPDPGGCTTTWASEEGPDHVVHTARDPRLDGGALLTVAGL